MSSEELTRLERELELAREKHHADFERWYSTAAMTSVESYCETGWLVWRVLVREKEL